MNQYYGNDYTTKCNLQIQCNHYQIINGIFHRARSKNFIIHGKTQKTLNRQSSLEKEECSWRNQPSRLQIIIRSYSHQDSMVLAQKQKYTHAPMGTLFLTKEARIYNGKKTSSLTSGAGKTGQPLVKE